MRSLVVTLLTGLLLACPFICGADEIGHGARHEATSGDTGDGHSPDQCPEGGDGCVCRGAVQASDARALFPDMIPAGPNDFLAARPRLAPPTNHLTRNGLFTGLAGWGDGPTVRAYLQNFRF